ANWTELRNFLDGYEENETYEDPALLRLIAQFNDRFLVSLVNKLQRKESVENAWMWLKDLYEKLQKPESNLAQKENPLPSFIVIRRHFWKKWIKYAVGKSALPELATLFAI